LFILRVVLRLRIFDRVQVNPYLRLHFIMVKGDKSSWKASYFTKVVYCFDNYSKCFVVGADNVGSSQMHEIRASIRPKATLLMGKNTMMRKAIRGQKEIMPSIQKLLPYIVTNVGLVFTNEDLCEVRDILLLNKKRAPARAGAIAPCIVTVPSQNTGLGPEKTSFFQALQIPTKIARGTIEITVLDIKEEDILTSFREGLSNLTAACLYVGFPTMASVPQSVVKGFTKLLAVAACTDYSFKEAEFMKSILSDPEKLAALQAAASAAPAAADSGAAAAEAAPAAKEESEEESDDDMGFGLFD